MQQQQNKKGQTTFFLDHLQALKCLALKQKKKKESKTNLKQKGIKISKNF